MTSTTEGILVTLDKEGKEGERLAISGYLGTDAKDPRIHLFLLKK